MQSSVPSQTLLKLVRYSWPSGIEYVFVGALSVLILLVGNARDLLAYYGLDGSSAVLHQRLSAGLGSGLTKLDSFQLTRSAVSFTVWCLVGLIVLSIIQSFLYMSGLVSYQKQLASERYVHPAGFSKRHFWQEVRLHFAVSLGFWILFASVAAAYLLLVLPQSFRQARQFLLAPQPDHLAHGLYGLLILFGGTLMLYTAVKLVFLRHRQ